MAPMAVDTAGSSQRQTRRRIVPAIPLRLSRNMASARPVTPDESSKGPITQQEPKPRAFAEKPAGTAEQQLPATAAEAPMTPDSRASVAAKSEGEAPVLATSPAGSADDHVEHTDFNEHDQSNGSHDTPTASHADSRPVVNGVCHKLTIPTELPPPFYPTHNADNQTPPPEGSDTTHAPSLRPQLSAGAAAFNVADDESAVPATTHEADLDGRFQQPTLPRPPPGFAPPEFTPSFFPGHSHHPSDVGVPWPYPPYSAAPPDPVYGNGTNYQSSSFSTGPAAHPGPYNGNTSTESAINGVATSHSQSPSKSQFGEAKSSSEQAEEHHAMPHQNGTAFQSERLDESPFELAAYLSTQFGNPEFADFILQIRSPESIVVSIPVHGIIVVRSPTIAKAIRRSVPTAHRSRDARRLLDVLTSDLFITRESLVEAVKVLYGAPLLSAQTFLYGIAPYVYESDQAAPSNDAQRRMRQLLAYIASGRALQMPSMQARGVEIARLLLRWDTIDQVLHFALESSSVGRSRSDAVDADDPFTAALLNYAIDFMAYTFPVDFKLYTIAPELQEIPRLPVAIESRPLMHNPRLSKIRFGDAPPEDDLQPNHASRILSSILLSLPLPLVDRLFNHRATANQIGWTGVVKVMRDLIDERENRRRKATTAQLQPSQDSAALGALMNNLYVEERVEQVDPSPLHPSGYRLALNRLAEEF